MNRPIFQWSPFVLVVMATSLPDCGWLGDQWTSASIWKAPSCPASTQSWTCTLNVVSPAIKSTCAVVVQVCAALTSEAQYAAAKKLTPLASGYVIEEALCEQTTSASPSPSPSPTPQTAPLCADLRASGTGGSTGAGGAPACGAAGAACLDNTGCCAPLQCALNSCD